MGTMRLFDLNTGATVRTFQGHTKDVYSVAFSGDNRQIVSGSRDKTIKLWNTLAECKYTITEDMHTDWVSVVVFSPSAKMPLIVSAGWDKNYWLCAATDTSIKVWDLENKAVLDELSSTSPPKNGIPWCVSLQWSADGNTLFAGSTDGNIYVYEVGQV